jgi:DNA replication and repair protein RecF
MLTSIKLQHFRSYDNAEFKFSPGVNIIVGPNAIGKTNLLEAILVACRGSSYRVKDAELVAYGQEWARLDAETSEGLRTIKLVQSPLPDKTYGIAGRSLKRLSLQQTLPAVLFEPNHLQLLHGSPEQRRDYLDSLLEQTQPGFGKIRRDYKKTIAQRNALLKRGEQVARQQIFPWDIRAAELGGLIVAQRHALLLALNARASALYSDLAGRPSQLQLHYVSGLPEHNYETHLLSKLESNLARDVERGFTGAGPHREDFKVELNDHHMQQTASRGEVRTAVLMLKILELEQIEQARDIRPLLLLDDVFSELDQDRRKALTSYLQAYQTFITTTDADAATAQFKKKAKVIKLQG